MPPVRVLPQGRQRNRPQQQQQQEEQQQHAVPKPSSPDEPPPQLARVPVLRILADGSHKVVTATVSASQAQAHAQPSRSHHMQGAPVVAPTSSSPSATTANATNTITAAATVPTVVLSTPHARRPISRAYSANDLQRIQMAEQMGLSFHVGQKLDQFWGQQYPAEWLQVAHRQEAEMSEALARDQATEASASASATTPEALARCEGCRHFFRPESIHPACAVCERSLCCACFGPVDKHTACTGCMSADPEHAMHVQNKDKPCWKPPPSAYSMWLRENKRTIQKSRPSLRGRSLYHHCAQAWEELDPTQKQLFEERHKGEVERYEAAVAKWTEQHQAKLDVLKRTEPSAPAQQCEASKVGRRHTEERGALFERGRVLKDVLELQLQMQQREHSRELETARLFPSLPTIREDVHRTSTQQLLWSTNP